MSEPFVGQLDTSEMRILGERIISVYRFGTRLLLERQIRELAARHQARDADE